MSATSQAQLMAIPTVREYRGTTRIVPRLLVALTFAFASAPALADEVSSGLESIGQRVPDEQLATMRGKFISPDSVSYFGIMMETSWQGPDGITTQANLLFRIDFTGGSGSPTPQLSVGWRRDGDSALDLSSFGPAAQSGYVAVGANGIVTPLVAANSSGAVQSNIIAGADNHALNGMSIAVVPASAVDHSTPSGLANIASSQTSNFANGDQLQFKFSAGSVGLSFSNGANSAQQQVDGALKQASQSITLSGDHYSASNLMAITIGINPSQTSNQIQFDQALLSRATLGF